MRNIDQGDWVKKGTVLAVVRQQDYQDKVQQAQAQLARSQADYDKAKLSFDRVSALYASKARPSRITTRRRRSWPAPRPRFPGRRPN